MGLPANISELSKGIAQTLNRQNVTAVEGKQYMKMTKTGQWVYGKDQLEVEEGSEWAINPNAFALGFIAFPEEGGRPLGEEMALVQDAPVLESELPHVNAPWTQQVGIQLHCTSGEDAGVDCILKGTSKGLKDAFNELLKMVLKRIDSGESAVVPIVTLETGSYQHPKKALGTIITPEFKLVKWGTLDGKVEDTPEEKEPEVKEEPARRRRRA